jgi:hypothetical protein
MADETRKPDTTPDNAGFKKKPGEGETAQPPPLGETIRIDAGPHAAPKSPGALKSETTRIDIAAAKPPTGKLIPKAETTRVDVSAAQPPGRRPAAPGISPQDETQQVQPPPKPAAPVEAKRATMRIDISEPTGPKKDTTRLVVPPDAAKSQTSKIDIRQASEPVSEDVLKRAGIPVGIPTLTPPPPSSPMTRPKTIQIKRPMPVSGETILVSPASTARVAEEAKKSETARIDLPSEGEDRPATRPKTIRIKRPDGTTARKPLTIARPTAAQEAAAIPQEVTVVEDMPGNLYSVVAILAVIVALTLVYVLAAQTIAPTLPFWGRIA